jgi:hypothetical protein
MSSALVPYKTRPLSLRDRRAVTEVREARRPARRAAARLDAAAIVAEVGLDNIERLTAAEVAVCLRQGALIDARAREVVDAYVSLVRREVLALGWGGE